MDKTSTEKISGYVEHIIYRNTENGYTVFELIADGEEITCVGSFQAIDEGEGLELSGGYVEHAVYGSQFKVESYGGDGPGGRTEHRAVSGLRGHPGSRSLSCRADCEEIRERYLPDRGTGAGAPCGDQGDQRTQGHGDRRTDGRKKRKCARR